MISYSLVSDRSHKFDAWFKNADAFDEQAELIGRPLAQRLEAPAANQLCLIEDTENDVGIPDVDG